MARKDRACGYRPDRRVCTGGLPGQWCTRDSHRLAIGAVLGHHYSFYRAADCAIGVPSGKIYAAPYHHPSPCAADPHASADPAGLLRATSGPVASHAADRI
ncbi:MAG: hypothetical protein JW918_01335 [Anaerolineae bacterium]|nr:hypothetical protein [Anaerolineae bacterium]